MLKRYSLSLYILLTFSLIFLLVIGAGCLIINHYLVNDADRQNRDYLCAYVDTIAQQAESQLDMLNHISVQVYYSKEIINDFSASLNSDALDNYFGNNKSVIDRIDSNIYPIVGPDLDNVIVNMYNENGFYSSKYYPVDWPRVCASMEEGYLAGTAHALDTGKTLLVQRVDNAYWTIDTFFNHSYISLSRFFQKYTVRKNIGYVEVLMPISRFEKMFETNGLEQMSVLLDPERKILCVSSPPDTAYTEDLQAFLSEAALKSDEMHFTVGDHTYLFAIKPIEGYDLSILTLRRQDAAIYWLYSKIVITIGVSIYLLTLVVCAFVSQRLSRPINRIVASLREVSWDKLEMNLNLDSSYGDFDVLEESYSAMMTKLHDAVNLLIDSRLNEQKAIYLALQSQISPHFIYNTIANISAYAYEYGAYKIVDICDQLSGLLRYATNYNDSLSDIQSELEYTRNYLNLMKIRYEDKFFYNITTSDDCAHIHIPRLITQTVIENCFKHSFKDKPMPWFISVSAYIENGWWMISISHNGDAIPAKQLEEILKNSAGMYENIVQGMEKLNLGGLGLLNSITRLRVLYDNQIRFEVFTDKNNSSVTRFGGKLK